MPDAEDKRPVEPLRSQLAQFSVEAPIQRSLLTLARIYNEAQGRVVCPSIVLSRSSFISELASRLDTARHNCFEIAVMKFNIVNFSYVNNTFGFEAADAFLGEMGRRLQSWFDDDDLVALLGGDNFAVACRISSASAVFQVAEEFIRAQKEFLNGFGPLTIKSGLALFPEDGDNVRQLLNRARLALRHAKNHAAGVVRFKPGMNEASEESGYLSRQIKAGLDNNEFALFYQPIISLSTNNIVAVEALLRWRNPQHGLLNSFIFWRGVRGS